jgi:D-alanyl-D-alanine endopeptidase (penicillin-binding protein 7)
MLLAGHAQAAGKSTPLRSAEYDAAPAAPQLSALSVLVLDQKGGLPIYQKNIDMETPIASISKLMTAMVVLDAHLDMNETLEITEADVDKLRHTSSRIAAGTRLSRGELMHLALIASENRAASALSRNYPGGHSKFIEAMNRKAKSLGMAHTAFEDATGLSSNNQSTAADLAKMVDAAVKYPLIHEITTTGQYEITRTAMVMVGKRHHKKPRNIEQRVAFHNTNQLVRDQEWDIGLSKTGFINEAGHCLVMQAKIAQKPVIIVLLDANGRYGRISDAKHIKTWLEQQPADKIALRMDRTALN